MGFIGLAFYDGGLRHFYSVKQAIRTPADSKGLRVRVQQADIWTNMLRAVGAQPVVVPTDRVYLKLQSGVIDASEQNWPSYVTLRHYHVAPYLSLTGHSMTPAVLVFSKRVWDTLSAGEQTIIRDAARDSVPIMRRLWDDYEVAAERTAEKAGAKIVRDVDRKAFADQLVAALPLDHRGSPAALDGATHPGRRAAGAAVRTAEGLKSAKRDARGRQRQAGDVDSGTEDAAAVLARSAARAGDDVEVAQVVAAEADAGDHRQRHGDVPQVGAAGVEDRDAPCPARRRPRPSRRSQPSARPAHRPRPAMRRSATDRPSHPH